MISFYFVQSVHNVLWLFCPLCTSFQAQFDLLFFRGACMCTFVYLYASLSIRIYAVLKYSLTAKWAIIVSSVKSTKSLNYHKDFGKGKRLTMSRLLDYHGKK